MDKTEQVEFFDRYVQQAREMLLKKGDDYANKDRLSNFKNVGQICGTSPQLACLHLIATKVARLSELYSGKSPKNESIQDSQIDLTCYSILLAMIEDDLKANVHGTLATLGVQGIGVEL